MYTPHKSFSCKTLVPKIRGPFTNRFVSRLTSNYWGGGGGVACGDVIKLHILVPHVGAELLNIFAGKARCYTHDCSWDLPGSRVYRTPRSLCWVYVLDTL